MKLTILLADDHPLVCHGLRGLIEGESQMKVVGVASNGRQALEMAQTLCPDVVIMDIAMPELNGVEATRRIHASDPKVKVIAMSSYADSRSVSAALEAGACGYIVKSGAGEEILRAIRAVMEGKMYLSPEVAGMVVEGFVQRLNPAKDPPGPNGLTSREREVVQLVAEAHSNAAIASRLGICEATVEVHRRNIMKKLNLHTVAELTRYAIREGISAL